MPMTVSKTGTMMTFGSTIATVIGTLLHAVAFATDYWLVSDGRSVFVRIGFHTACFNQCTIPYCPAGEGFVYDGCAWLFNIYYREIQKWLVPPWFEQVRNLVIILVPLTGVVTIVMLIATVVVCVWRYPRPKPKSRDVLLQVLLFIGAAIQFATAVLMIVVIVRFYVKSSRNWMPIPEKNSLGFSYWLEVVACFLFFIASIISISGGVFKVLRMRKGPKDPQVSEDMMLGRI